jgi:hypothetical protein
MQYLFLIYADEDAVNALPAEDRRAIYAAHLAPHRELPARGVLRHAAPLADSPAARTLGADGVITDGPCAETKEQLGSSYLVDCADPEDAAALSRRFPPAPGQHVEIRPVMEV